MAELEEKYKYVTYEDIELGVNNLCYEINNHELEFDVVMGVNFSGLLPAICTARKLRVDHYPLDSGLTNPKSKDYKNIIPFLKKDKNILIVDGVSMTGNKFQIIDSKIKQIQNYEIKNHTCMVWYACLYKYSITTFKRSLCGYEVDSMPFIVFPWEKW